MHDTVLQNCFQWPFGFLHKSVPKPTVSIACVLGVKGTVRECQESSYGFLAEEARTEDV